MFAGAPAYKAPELLCSKPIYSEASDMFAFSIVSWEMLTTLWSGTYGRPWSDIDTSEKLQTVILEGKRPPIEPRLVTIVVYFHPLTDFQFLSRDNGYDWTNGRNCRNHQTLLGC